MSIRVWKILLGVSILLFANLILFISIFRSASVEPDFKQKPVIGGSETTEGVGEIVVYDLIPAGSVLPDSPLWPLKAIRDKIWLVTTTSPTRKSELTLLLADKRLAAAIELFDKGEYETGFTTLVKAEGYLTDAVASEVTNRQMGMDTREFLDRLALSSLKHREELNKIVVLAPEDARPDLLKLQDIPIQAFLDVTKAFRELGLTPPQSPFEGR